jgi:hypothetical protein
MNYVLPIAIVACAIGYVSMVGSTFAIITSIGRGPSDSSAYALKIPLSIAFSGIFMGFMMGIYAYSTIDVRLVFAVSILFSCFALGFAFSALGLSAITH